MAAARQIVSFRKAKEQFEDIVDYFVECLRALRDMKYTRIQGRSLVDPAVFRGKHIDDMLQRIDSMMRDIQRAKVKIVSAGKADSCRKVLINAILGQTVIPRSYDTDSPSPPINRCFVHIEGSKEDALCFVRENGQEERFRDTKVMEMELQMAEFEPQSVIKVHLPSSEFKFLEDDLVLIDGPDLDHRTGMATMFRRQCQDCNVFVLAANLHDGIDDSTKEFVKTLYRRLPGRQNSTFVVFLGWNPRGTDDIDNTKMSEARRFLTNELRVSQANASTSVYWLPTNEIQNIRQESENSAFARQFKEFCALLKSKATELAVRKTLLHPFESINDMNNDMRNILRSVLEEVQRKLQQQTQRRSIFSDIKSRIIQNESILDEVRNKVTSSCCEHLKHISRVTLNDDLQNDHGEIGWGSKLYNKLVEELDRVRSLREVDRMFTKHTEELWAQIMQELSNQRVCVCKNGTCYSAGTDSQTCPKIATMRETFIEDGADQGQTTFKLDYKIADYGHFMSGFQEQLDNLEFCFDGQVLQFLPTADQWPNRDGTPFVETDNRIDGSGLEGSVSTGNLQGSYATCRATSGSPDDDACGPRAHSEASSGTLNIFSVETRDGRILAKGAVTDRRSVVFKAHRVRLERDTLFKMQFLNFALLKLIACVDEVTERVVANFSEQLKEYWDDVVDYLEDCLQLRDNRLICEKLGDMEGKLKENEECCEQTKKMLCEFLGEFLN